MAAGEPLGASKPAASCYNSGMTSIRVNGKAQALAGQPTITEMLQELGLAEKRVAVELNREIVPRSLHGETRLKAGDRIEIVHAIGGG